MNETFIFSVATGLVSVGICWYIMREKIKNIQQELDDKRIIIKELTDYTTNVKSNVDLVVVKKPTTKQAKTKKTTKSTSEVKKRTKKDKIWSIVRNGEGAIPLNPYTS